ncbi:hypothetical protein P676_1591 [Acinetobacter baumannii UH7607]|nr:hypothetical protein ACINNAV18_1528 [Acinetobacter baumannii Naval-18]ETQ12872.1 hypothetical protein P647_2210 [Acinetobacter baumannii UH12208]ETQ40420.1 hypothetical protein P656_3758 [Acinetobacter baumannii UH16208]ETQ50897.1 hypothetical protein P658_1295 [Acinetobacter baumannii UH19608]ETQ64456.1 hypothetical protein P662_2068 [Acinetobacter baumannii UH22908]ETR08959.1 hypothetical protein P676_1591 [Acinetobacter baumannii UH7607]ETR12149.1 hypothetical protein P674_0966 [Acineto
MSTLLLYLADNIQLPPSGAVFYLTSLNDQHIKLIKNVSKYGNVL